MEKSTEEIISKLGSELVDFIKTLGQFYETVVFTPYGHLSLKSFYIPRPTYYRKLKKFERAGLIKKQSRSAISSFVLSPQGRQICQAAVKKENRSDGLMTLVLFDIPIRLNRARTIFRRFLVKNGYTLIQKSALIGPWQLSSDIRELAGELKISEFINIFGVKKELF